VRVFLEKDERRALPIPYWTRGDPARRFWNLKRDPKLARNVRELRGCPELREFVLGTNARTRFATLGCAHWIKPDEEDETRVEAGLYVDLVFDRLENARRAATLELARRLQRAARRAGSARGVTIIRVQLQTVAFRKLGEAWLLSTWVFGGGRTTAVAKAARRRGLELVADVCARVSREIAATRGNRGTPIPP
jgi:hypothetical protein